MRRSPIALARHSVRVKAFRQGLLGGDRFWLTVWLLRQTGGFAGRVTKRGEPPVVYSAPVASGHWNEIAHEEPEPARRSVRHGAKASARAERRARAAERDPTPRRLRRAVKAQRRAYKANRGLGKRRSPFQPLTVEPDLLGRRQRRVVRRSVVEPLGPLERLAVERTW